MLLLLLLLQKAPQNYVGAASTVHVQPFVACSALPPPSYEKCLRLCVRFIFIYSYPLCRVGRSAGWEAPNFSFSFGFGFSFSFRLIEFRLLSINKEQLSNLLFSFGNCECFPCDTRHVYDYRKSAAIIQLSINQNTSTDICGRPST